MKKNGFTLIELIAVIVVLGILLTFASISAISIMNKSKKDMGNFTLEQVEDAAKTYALDNDCDNTCRLTGKDNIIDKLSSYYPEMEEKCTFDENAYIEITEKKYDESDADKNGDTEVDIVDITCEG